MVPLIALDGRGGFTRINAQIHDSVFPVVLFFISPLDNDLIGSDLTTFTGGVTL